MPISDERLDQIRNDHELIDDEQAVPDLLQAIKERDKAIVAGQYLYDRVEEVFDGLEPIPDNYSIISTLVAAMAHSKEYFGNQP